MTGLYWKNRTVNVFTYYLEPQVSVDYLRERVEELEAENDKLKRRLKAVALIQQTDEVVETEHEIKH